MIHQNATGQSVPFCAKHAHVRGDQQGYFCAPLKKTECQIHAKSVSS